jgi:cobalt-zinc-cadmium resistance protein CzcA
LPARSSSAHIELEEGPNQVSREQGKRRVVVQANVRGRDIGSFVSEAQSSLRERVRIPPGYRIAWGGEFENILSARKRLAIVLPLTLVIVPTLPTLLVLPALYRMLHREESGPADAGF